MARPRARRPQAELLCADLDSVEVARAVGADRIELCAAPEVGGLTPGAGLLEQAIAALDGALETVVLVRPRVGGFTLRGARELRALVADVEAARAAGASGVAVGVLSGSGALHREAMAELVAAAEGLAVTLHRAIDLSIDLVASAGAAAELGVARILTSGGAPTALKGAAGIARLVEAVGDRVEVVAAAGVRGSNAAQVLGLSGAGGLHGSCSGEAAHETALGMGTLRPMDRTEAAGLVAAVRGVASEGAAGEGSGS